MKDNNKPKNNQKTQTSTQPKVKEEKLIEKYPFWARLKISKNRTTLVIDESPVYNKKTKKIEDGYVHREATSKSKPDYEEIYPNPDKTKNEAMYLKRPRKLPKKLFTMHNKNLDMPKYLKERYERNNKK